MNNAAAQASHVCGSSSDTSADYVDACFGIFCTSTHHFMVFERAVTTRIDCQEDVTLVVAFSERNCYNGLFQYELTCVSERTRFARRCE